MGKKRWVQALVVCGIFAAMAVYIIVDGRVWENKEIVFREHLQDQILTVDGADLTLSDIAFYVAYEELEVEKQAHIYSPEDTNQYWNIHTNGVFLKTEAKQHVIDMAVHDEIFSKAAAAGQLELDEEDLEQLAGAQEDFWYDLTGEQRELLGVGREELDAALYKVALAEKYQAWIAGETGIHYESFRAGGTAYEEQVLPEHEYQVNEALWEKVPFGNIIVPHVQE